MHPAVLQAIAAANQEHAPAYGKDEWTRQAVDCFRQHFGPTVEVFFVFNGTAANVLSFQAMNCSFQAVLCTDCAHVNVDECGAPEKHTGAKLLTVPAVNGKLTPEQLTLYLHQLGVEHNVQPALVSITQSTEVGTVYRPDEIRAIADFAHNNGMLLHMDGARLCNAAAFLGVSLKALTADVGVDILSFGGTKNGLMGGEAVVFFNPDHARAFPYIRKQGMQLASKMRFISAQFIALFRDELWLTNARHANAMAQILAEKISSIPELTLTQPVEANGLFVQLPPEWIKPLQAQTPFYIWDETRHIARWMTAFDTTTEDVDQFVAVLQQLSHQKIAIAQV